MSRSMMMRIAAALLVAWAYVHFMPPEILGHDWFLHYVMPLGIFGYIGLSERFIKHSRIARKPFAVIGRMAGGYPIPAFLVVAVLVSEIFDISFMVSLLACGFALIPVMMLIVVWDMWSTRAAAPAAPKPGEVIRDRNTGMPIINSKTGKPYVVPGPGEASEGIVINPASGAMMVGGMGGVDLYGNAYGTTSSYDPSSSHSMGSDFGHAGHDWHSGHDWHASDHSSGFDSSSSSSGFD